jgi:uncharacterized phiE125 gp8 family phage protein
MQLVRIEAPTLEIVSVADMRAHLRVDGTDEDGLIASLIDAAVAYLDGWQGVLGMALGAQRWRLEADAFPAGEIEIPFGPVIEVQTVEYRDASGAFVTIPALDYRVQIGTRGARIAPVSGWWPSVDELGAVRVTFRAGHTTLAAIHKAVPLIVKLLVAHWYENREAVAVAGRGAAEMPMSATALIAAVRRFPV